MGRARRGAGRRQGQPIHGDQCAAVLLPALAAGLLVTATHVPLGMQVLARGIVFINLAIAQIAGCGVLLLASNVRGSEHLRDLLVGQILWVQPSRLVWAAVVYAVVLAIWFGCGERLGRVGFYILFALSVTISVQLVGLSLVFATLIVPSLATRRMTRGRLPAAWPLGGAGYAAGLLLSTTADLPSGPVIVWTLVALALATGALAHRRAAPA